MSKTPSARSTCFLVMLLYQLPVLLAYVPLLGYSALGREGGHVWAVKVQGVGERAERELQTIADTVANNLGLVNHGRIEPFHNVFQFEGNSRRVGRSAVAAVHASLEGHPGVVWASLQRPLTRTKREAEFRDPFFSKQWHLVSLCVLSGPQTLCSASRLRTVLHAPIIPSLNPSLLSLSPPLPLPPLPSSLLPSSPS